MLITKDCGMPIIKPFASRIKVATTVHYEPCHGMALSGLSDDLSVGGLYLRTNLLLGQNEGLKVSFPLPGQEKVVSCNASVAWTNFAVNRRKPETPKGVGLQFEDLSLEDLIALSTFVGHHNEETTMTVPPVQFDTNLSEFWVWSGAISYGKGIHPHNKTVKAEIKRATQRH